MAPSVMRSAQSTDPAVALAALRELRDFVEAHEEGAVRRARQAGLSWQSIAELIGRRRSSVWERYHHVDD